MQASKIIAIVSSAAVAVAAVVAAVVFLVPGECKHESTEWRTVSEATCTADGARNRICKDCGEVVEIAEIDALGHTEVVDSAKAPTCTEAGLTEGKHCSVCNATIVAQQPIDKVAHTYDNDTDADCNVCGATREVACTHAETEILAGKAATCTATGLTDGTKCKKCGETIVAQETLPMVAHNYDNKYDEDCNVCGHKRDAECGHFETEVIVGKAATCTATGMTDGAKCKKCGEITVAQQTIPKISHIEVKIPGKDATCTATGLTEGKKCSVCGTVAEAQQTIPKISHTEVKVPGEAATCTATGLTEGKKCSVCGTVTVAQKTTPKVAHTYDDKYDETCNKCGFVRDAECAHINTETIEGYDSTCTETGLTDGKKCKKCGEITEAQRIISTKPHTEAIDAAVAATCTSTGLTEGKHCSVCNTVTVAQKKVAMKPHTEVIDAAVAATCTSTGLTEGKHCSVCEAVIVAQTVTDMKPHTEAIDAAVAATCTSTGLTEGKHCSVCNKTIVAQKEIAIKPHTEVEIPGKAATCTSTGLTDGKRCSVCNVTLLEQVVTPMIAHTYDDKYDATCNKCGFIRDAECAHTETEIIKGYDATCTQTGLTHGKKCKICGEIIVVQIIISVKSHTEVTDEAVDPTCTTTGLTEGIHCSVCNKVIVAQTIVSATGHTEVIDPAVAPTCTQTGLTQGKHCSVCGKVIVAQTVIPAKGHTPSDWIIDSEATCTTDGSKHKKCAVCGETVQTENIVKFGHNNINGVCTVCKVELSSEGLEYILSGDGAYYIVSGIGTCKDTDIVIPSIYDALPVTSIGDYAFRNCTSLTSITIPASVTGIGFDAFRWCTSLASINFEGTIEQWNAIIKASDWNSVTGDYIIYCTDGTIAKDGTITYYEVASKGLEFTCNDDGASYSVTGIGTCIDTEIVIPSTYNGCPVISIGGYAFSGCTSITSVTIPNSVTSIANSVFKDCTALTDVVIPDTLTEMGSYIFSGCTSLKEIALPSNLNVVPAGAFSGCKALEYIRLPASITSIGDKAFRNCTGLVQVYDISGSLISIGARAFEGCTSLAVVYYKATTNEWTDIKKGSMWKYNARSFIVRCKDGYFDERGLEYHY